MGFSTIEVPADKADKVLAQIWQSGFKVPRSNVTTICEVFGPSVIERIYVER